MFNTDYPDRADLPTTEKLVRSTIIAGIASLVILVTIVLPSEYGIDPTRVGSLLGLTPMGEIKVQLAQEAAQASTKIDASATASIGSPQSAGAPPSPVQAAAVQALEQRVAALEAMISPAQPLAAAPQPEPVEAPATLALVEPLAPVATAPAPVQSGWNDEISFVLTPGQGTEYKMVMAAGAVANFEFQVDGGVINYDQHGEGQGQSFSYEQGRAVQGGNGTIQAPVEGTHGWFFRNRGTVDVVVTLRTGGDYFELRKLI